MRMCHELETEFVAIFETETEVHPYFSAPGQFMDVKTARLGSTFTVILMNFTSISVAHLVRTPNTPKQYFFH